MVKAYSAKGAHEIVSIVKSWVLDDTKDVVRLIMTEQEDVIGQQLFLDIKEVLETMLNNIKHNKIEMKITCPQCNGKILFEASSLDFSLSDV